MALASGAAAGAWRRGPVIAPQQFVIEFANRFERGFELLIIGERAAHRTDALREETELAGAAARIAHGEDRELMPFAARAFGAALGMVADRPLQQRAAQDVGFDRQARDQLRSRRDDLLTSPFFR